MPFCSLLPRSTSLMLSGRFSRSVLLILSSSSLGTLIWFDMLSMVFRLFLTVSIKTCSSRFGMPEVQNSRRQKIRFDMSQNGHLQRNSKQQSSYVKGHGASDHRCTRHTTKTSYRDTRPRHTHAGHGDNMHTHHTDDDRQLLRSTKAVIPLYALLSRRKKKPDTADVISRFYRT